MRTPWVLGPAGEVAPGARIALDREESLHLRTVLRIRPGDHVVVADGEGRVGDAVVRTLDRSAVQVEVAEVNQLPRPSGPGLDLAVGVLHGQAMDWVVQKAVELGVRRLVPLVCGRSQGSMHRVRERHEHWQRVSRQALKQCHRPWAMELSPGSELDRWVSDCGAPGTVADADGQPLEAVPQPARSRLLVGPEGGLTRAEKELLGSSGWSRLRLGPHTLRAETAAVAGAAVLLHRTAG